MKKNSSCQQGNIPDPEFVNLTDDPDRDKFRWLIEWIFQNYEREADKPVT